MRHNTDIRTTIMNEMMIFYMNMDQQQVTMERKK